MSLIGRTRRYKSIPVARFIKKEKIVHQREWLEPAKKKYAHEKCAL